MKKLEKNLFLLSFIFLIIGIVICHIFTVPFEPFDELWNFQNIYKISNGLTIYQDANVIITPLFFTLGSSFLKIFGVSIISFRCFNILIFGTYFVLLYYIFKTLKIEKHLNILFLILSLVQILPIINGGANYNSLSFVFVFLGLLIYLKLQDKKTFHYLQGIIIFLIFFTKQNIGIFYTIGILFFEYIYKKNWKTFITNQIKKLVIFIILLTLSLTIFYTNGNLLDFINFAFGGLLDFGNSNLNIENSPYTIFLCLIILCLYFYILLNKKIFSERIINLERRKNLHLIGCIIIPITLSVFPIINTAHFMYFLPLYLIILFYFLDFTILKEIFNTEKSYKIINIISIILLLSLIIRMLFGYFVENKEYVKITNTSSPFYQMTITRENYNKISVITDYIKRKNAENINVIIIASDSALSMVPLKQNHKEFDLVFNGNLGYDGESKMIEKIKNSENTEFLIFSSEEDCFWQESEIIRTFITENLTKTGEILNYSIYENK